MKGEVKSHGITFGASRKVSQPKALSANAPYYTWNYLGDSKYPMAVFKFKYRSKDSLRQLLVIPRTPEPEDVKIALEDAPIDRDGSNESDDLNNLDGLNGNQRKKVEQYIRQLKTGNTNPNTADRQVKRERPVVANSIVVNKKTKKSQDEVEIIDLIDD